MVACYVSSTSECTITEKFTNGGELNRFFFSFIRCIASFVWPILLENKEVDLILCGVGQRRPRRYKIGPTFFFSSSIGQTKDEKRRNKETCNTQHKPSRKRIIAFVCVWSAIASAFSV